MIFIKSAVVEKVRINDEFRQCKAGRGRGLAGKRKDTQQDLQFILRGGKVSLSAGTSLCILEAVIQSEPVGYDLLMRCERQPHVTLAYNVGEIYIRKNFKVSWISLDTRANATSWNMNTELLLMSHQPQRESRCSGQRLVAQLWGIERLLRSKHSGGGSG